jgi:cyclopropane-fatty-acyl-phospholipid synthase
MNSLAQSFIEKALISVDKKINGPAPDDIQVHDKRFYRRVLLFGSMGLGESYVDGWWDVEALDVFFAKVLSRQLPPWVIFSLPNLLRRGINHLTNFPQWRAYHVGRTHYDIGNDLYEAMLGPTMAYSCGYWQDSRTLDEAQEAKFDRICRKLNLQKGQSLLDIGCGWGGLARHAVACYGVKVVGITVSREQEQLARKFCYGLPIEIRYQDYRDLNGQFDHIVSIGMFEHVGYKNYHTFMQVVQNLLKDNGLFLLHTIGSNRSVVDADPWITKYIFPDSKIPSLAQITRAAEGAFLVEDVENIGAHYDKTLMAWWHNVEAHWPQLRSRYDERFRRMWRYYLLLCAGIFRCRRQQVWQIILSKHGVSGGYRRIG